MNGLTGCRSAFGSIVTVTGPSGARVDRFAARARATAKTALEVLCRYFAVALAPRGITVNAISPGWTVDSVFNTLPEPVQQMIRDRQEEGWTPMRRLGTPPDIANAVTLFCSKEAAWMTGQVIAVDGGASLMDPALPLAIQQAELQPA